MSGGRAPQLQGAVARSPFPPIASFAFLSDCHTGALVAPDGSVAWLCPPRFDAPSVFATILDRQAGYFRFGPFDVNAPSARNYEPGTNVLVTTWKTPTGWAEVRDALTILPRSEPDTTTPHTRAPGDDDAGHCLVRTVTCLDGHVELELICEPVFDYGRTEADWVPTDAHCATASGAGTALRLRSDLQLGVQGGHGLARRGSDCNRLDPHCPFIRMTLQHARFWAYKQGRLRIQPGEARSELPEGG